MRRTGGGGLARVPNLRVCDNPFSRREWHTLGKGMGESTWYRLVGVAKASSETERRKSWAARKGKWPPRGTETTVFTYPRSAPR